MKVVYIASLLCVLSNAPCLGQLRIDKPVLLTGSATADRQVTGLTPYTAPGDALIASEEQSGTLRFVDDVQGNNWQVSLNSLDVALQPGTQLVIVPPSIAPQSTHPLGAGRETKRRSSPGAGATGPRLDAHQFIA